MFKFSLKNRENFVIIAVTEFKVKGSGVYTRQTNSRPSKEEKKCKNMYVISVVMFMIPL